MDPNANLARQEYILDIKLSFPTSGDNRRAARAELKELRLALKAWILAGMFEPTWALCPNARKHFRK